MITEQPETERYPWKKRFAWLPTYIKKSAKMTAFESAYGDGETVPPKIRLWWEWYEWRYTGRTWALFYEIEYRIPTYATTFFEWEECLARRW